MTPAHQAAILARLACEWDAHDACVAVLREQRRRQRISATMRRRNEHQRRCLAEGAEREARVLYEWRMSR
jgi:glycine cleavage system regulatory protein